MKYRAYKTLWEECIRDNKVRRILVIELILRNSMDNEEQKTEEFKNGKSRYFKEDSTYPLQRAKTLISC